MDLHVNKKLRFLSTPLIHPPPLPHLKTKKVCLANLSDILVGSKNNLLHGLGRNLESLLESDAHHSSLVNKKKKTLYLLYFHWYSRLPITRNKRNKKDNSFLNITLWLLVNATEHEPDTSTPYTKIGSKQQQQQQQKTKMARFTRGKSVFSPDWWANQERLLESIAYLQTFPRTISGTRSIRLPQCPYKAASQKKTSRTPCVIDIKTKTDILLENVVQQTFFTIPAIFARA